jgi:hypothetical protein
MLWGAFSEYLAYDQDLLLNQEKYIFKNQQA